jgi:EAL domain-containing protein (putative c-di-GMP-specific phosphodiesterase class I)
MGMNDFFTYASCFGELNQGRAKKLLTAFKEGRWRTKVKKSQPSPHIQQPPTERNPNVSFAFQPIIDANSSSILSFEAIARGLNNEILQELEEKIPPYTLSTFDTHCRTLAIGMACRLGLKASLSLNFMARHIKDTPLSIRATLDAAERYNMGRIILEIDQDKLIGDSEQLGKVIEAFRGAGLKISINHFGAGRTGLNLLESFHPEMISLNKNLVQGIDSNSSRQAIVRGVTQTCAELGIAIIANHVETLAEYAWLRRNGIHLFQGDLIAKPVFEQLPSAFYPAN